MERKGKYFELGYPDFYKGVSYTWPNQDLDYPHLLDENIDRLAPVIVDKLREHMDKFSVRKPKSPYPSCSRGMKGLTLGIDDGGRWIEVWNEFGSYFVNCHNLDSWISRAVCFDLGSDILELLDSEILAPRVLRKGKGFLLEYPMPDCNKISHPDFNTECLRNLFEIVELNTDITLIDSETQEIRNSDGLIRIVNGVCEGRDFKGWNVPKASWVISRICSLSRV